MSAEPPAAYEDLMAKAMAKREAGAHAEASTLHANAYRALSKNERRDGTGALIIKNCIVDYRLALAKEPQGLEEVKAHLALLHAELGLLDEFMHEPITVPPEVEEVRAELRPRIQELEQRQADLEAQQRPAVVDPEPTPQDLGQPDPMPKPEVGPSQSQPPLANVHTEPLHDTKATYAILGVGIASLAGGIAMLGGGSWMFPEIKRRGNALVRQYTQEVAEAHDRDRTPQQIEDDKAAQVLQLAEIDEFREASQRSAVGVVVSGAVFAAAGIGLTTWAIIRMKKSARVVSPQLGRGYAGFGIAGRF